MQLAARPFKIAGREFRSRLMIGTGKFSSPEAMRDALVASGTEIVTVALRRADLSGKKDPFANILEFIDPKRYLVLPNTSGAMNAEEAVRLGELAAAGGGGGRRGTRCGWRSWRQRRVCRNGSSSRFIPTRAICCRIRWRL